MINKFSGGNALAQALGGSSGGAVARAMEMARANQAGGGGGLASRIMERFRGQREINQAAQQSAPQYMPQQYNAPPQYQSFAQLFNQPQFDYSQVGDIYSRGAMPNNLLSRYNSLMSNLEQQQAAMVPRQAPQQPKMPYDPVKRPVMGNSQYMNFAQLFGGGRNG